MNSIIHESDPLALGHLWLDSCAHSLLADATSGSKDKIIERVIDIL